VFNGGELDIFATALLGRLAWAPDPNRSHPGSAGCCLHGRSGTGGRDRKAGSARARPLLLCSYFTPRPQRRAESSQPHSLPKAEKARKIFILLQRSTATENSGRHCLPPPPPPPLNRLGANNGVGRTATGGGGRRGARRTQPSPLIVVHLLTSHLQARW
jgi:hypothetical protein